ncbi:MAG: hypothetical protein KBT28_12510 [Bacteroidales bacterium]|nr:hypothetical protein [Candidatus Colimorpha merdihippi]
MFDGYFIVGVETPEGQATYHYAIDPYWEMFDCKEVEQAPVWDGHTPQEAIARIEHWNQRTERTCEGCIENDKTDDGDWCEMCSRCHPDLYRTKSASDTSDQVRTCRIIEDPYRPIFKCCSSCYMHMEGNEKSCPSCQAKVVG